MTTARKPAKGRAEACPTIPPTAYDQAIPWPPPVPAKGGAIPIHPRALQALCEATSTAFLLARLERGSTPRDDWSGEDDTEEALMEAHRSMLQKAFELALLRATSQRENREALTPSFEDFAHHLACVMEAIHAEP